MHHAIRRMYMADVQSKTTASTTTCNALQQLGAATMAAPGRKLLNLSLPYNMIN